MMSDKTKEQNDLILILFNYILQQPTKNNGNIEKQQKFFEMMTKTT